MEDEGGCLPDRVIEVQGKVVASLGLHGIIQVSVQVPVPVPTSNVLCTMVFRVPPTSTVQCCGSKSRLCVESRFRFLMTKNSKLLFKKTFFFKNAIFLCRPP
jgi:hypothetical protein